jgi:hypothetical protein
MLQIHNNERELGIVGEHAAVKFQQPDDNG